MARLEINRPDRRNAMTRSMWASVPALVGQAEAAPGVRVIVVASSTPGMFSAGADIGEYRDHLGDAEWGLANQQDMSAGTAALRASRLPVIAVVDGPAFGAGAALVLAADLRVASERASFAITPAKLGMVYPYPDLVALVDVVGAAAARRLLLTAATIDAETALRMGLVDQAVPIDDLAASVQASIDQLVGNSPTSIASMKQAIAYAAQGQRDEDDLTRAWSAESLRSADHREGAQAFLERRSPSFG